MSDKIKRVSSAHLDAILGIRHDVLDHGFIRVIDYMGDQSSIVQAARVSYGEGTQTPSTDRALLRYLMRHHHTTPFEMCEIKLHVKLPVFIARQWLRHRMASVNEISARYSILKNEFFLPDGWREQSATNKQGSGELLSDDLQDRLNGIVTAEQIGAGLMYSELIDRPDRMGYGVAREQARIVLPLSTYTEFYWKIDLHNLLHFLRLRTHPHAQEEIRAYANIILFDLLEGWLPDVVDAFQDYETNSVHLSRQELTELRHILFAAGVTKPVAEIAGCSKREVAAFNKALGLAE